MKYNIYLKVLFLAAFFAVASCANRKKMAYFQPTEGDSTVTNLQSYEVRYRTGDFLYIQVSGATPEAVAIFNPSMTNLRETYTGVYRNDNPQTTGYIIDKEGNINFPILGKIQAAGKTKLELEKLLLKELEGHIDTPVLNIRLRNFKVSVLGDVKDPGTYTISTERVTLLEALGIAGDLNITAKRKNILVVRTNQGKKEEYRVDLTSNEIFSSPVYYLQQNDVVYVEPNQAKMNTSKFSPVYSILISVSSLIITTIILITSN
tara:strand:+ start:10253 stop:11038 length:786 start_codon:yes stop_codon:yes gene_type:complete